MRISEATDRKYRLRIVATVPWTRSTAKTRTGRVGTNAMTYGEIEEQSVFVDPTFSQSKRGCFGLHTCVKSAAITERTVMPTPITAAFEDRK